MIYTATARIAHLAALNEHNNPIAALTNAGASATLDGTATLTDGARTNAFTGTTYDYWLPDVSGTDAELEMQFGAAATYSFAALVGHNLSDYSATVSIQRSQDGATWVDGGAGEVTPTDNKPIIWRMPASGNDAAYWRFYITGLTASDPIYVAVAFLGNEIVFPQRFYQGFAPVIESTDVALQSNVSEGGNLLGSSVVRRGSSLDADLSLIKPNFIRGDEFRAFQRGFNEGQGFFFAWRPYKYPEDCHYCWRSGDVIRAENTGPTDFMGFNFSARVYDG